MRGPAIGQREVRRERVDVADAGAPPAVDRLTRVADRGDRMTWPLADEQRREQQALGHRRVLVLIEKHHAIARAFGGADGRVLADEPGRPGELVGEIEDAPRALVGAQVVDDETELGSLAERSDGLLDLERRLGLQLQLREEGGVERPQVGGRDQVLRELTLEAHDVTDESAHRRVELPERTWRLAQHAFGELESRGVGEEVGLRFDADAQTVLTQQPAGVGVIGRDTRLTLRIGVAPLVVLRQPGER